MCTIYYFKRLSKLAVICNLQKIWQTWDPNIPIPFHPVSWRASSDSVRKGKIRLFRNWQNNLEELIGTNREETQCYIRFLSFGMQKNTYKK